VTREELARAQDMGDYFRVPMDGRDLNYGKYFTEGDKREIRIDDYTSENAEQLNVDRVIALLRSLPDVQAELKAAGHA
jgi:UDP-glucose 4-epimerase